MTKTKFSSEFEIKASAKVIFPYLSTPGGLSQWFADDVSFTPKKNLIMQIDGEEMFGKIASIKNNSSVKIEFLDDDQQEEDDASFVEMKLETNDLTGALYFIATDYSDFIESNEEHYELWEGLVDALCSIVGA